MALLATLAVAVATWSAARAWPDAGGLVGLGACLAAGVMNAMFARSAFRFVRSREVQVLTGVTVLGFVGVYVAGWTEPSHYDDVARLLPFVVAVLTVLWPQPRALRYCLLLAAGTLVGATVSGDGLHRWAVGTALVAMAAAMVATSRLTAADDRRLGGEERVATGRRVGTEAAALLVVVGLLAALAAALVPPPPGGGGGGGDGDAAGRPTLLRPAAPTVDFPDRLDVGAGRGSRGDEVVLLVEAPAPDVWRATTYDRWDGEAWARSPETLFPVEDFVLPGTGDVASAAPALDFVQTVTVQARSASVLVAAARPAYVGIDAPLRQGEDSSLFPARPLGRGERYLVSSERTPAPAAALRAASGPVPIDVADAYLQLPEVPAGVRALAADIAANEPTAYDKVRAVEDWLYEKTTVTDDAEPGTLETFLLDTRSGPPERTATAMAVMLRALGIPNRIAVGFLPGDRRGVGDEYVVRLRDSHAWVEVWFPGMGWQRFDPTGKAPPPEPEPDSIWDRLRRLWPLVALVVVAGIAAVAWWAVRRWRRYAALPWAARFLRRLEREGRARGRPRLPHETPAEYAAGLAEGALPDPRLEQVGEVVTVATYSTHEPPPEERARAEDVVRQAARAAPVRRFRRNHRPTIRKP